MNIKGAILNYHFIGTESAILNPVAVEGAAIEGHTGNTVGNRHRLYVRFSPHTHCHLTGTEGNLVKDNICRVRDLQRNGTGVEIAGITGTQHRAGQDNIN